MRLKRIVLFFVFSLLLCETSFLYERYEVLRNIGNKFEVVIEELGESEAKIGLTENRLRTITELRLRREGIILTSEASREIPVVYVNVNLVGPAYYINLLICEWVELKRVPYAQKDLRATKGVMGTLWADGGSGTHGGDSEAIVSSLNILFDEFFNDYYKANPKENKKGKIETSPEC